MTQPSPTFAKVRNALAETASLLGIAIAAIPQVSNTVDIPAWVGVVGALVITLINQWVKDSNPAPTPAVNSVTVTETAVIPETKTT